MKVPLYSVRDLHTGFGFPFPHNNDHSAKRRFACDINNEMNNEMHFSPADYQLYKVGYFDTDNAVYESIDIPELIVDGASVFGASV